MKKYAKDNDKKMQYIRQDNEHLFQSQKLLVCLILSTLDRQKNLEMEDSDESKIYYSCYTQNNDRTNIFIRHEKGKQCITGGTNNPFCGRKLY